MLAWLLCLQRFSEHVQDATATGTKIAATKALLESCNRSAIYVSLFTLYVYGGYLVRTGVVPISVFASFIGYTFILTFALQGVVNTLADARQMFAKLRRINKLLSTDVEELPSDKKAMEAPGAQATRATHEHGGTTDEVDFDVGFEIIHFAYPTRPDQEVIRGLNLTLPRGKMTALVGASGTGKSTLVHLLCRFYEPSVGKVRPIANDYDSNLFGNNLAKLFDPVAMRSTLGNV